MPRSIDMRVVKLTPIPTDVPRDLLKKRDELLAYYGDYLKSLPDLPKEYKSCIDKVHKEAKTNIDFKTNPLTREPRELQHTATSATQLNAVWNEIRFMAKEKQCDAVTTWLTQCCDYFASPDFPQK